ncbi:MAG: hypothetical protein WC827_01075 [Candidatus Paceibacterota bacterium]|jgi:hypothetical protein
MNKKNIIILIVVAIIFAFVGFYLFKNKSTDETLVSDSKVTNSGDAQAIYNLLQKMAKVKLDDSIFSNQIFQSLKDNSIEVAPQETGRDNPFAPIGTSVIVKDITTKR